MKQDNTQAERLELPGGYYLQCTHAKTLFWLKKPDGTLIDCMWRRDAELFAAAMNAPASGGAGGDAGLRAELQASKDGWDHLEEALYWLNQNHANMPIGQSITQWITNQRDVVIPRKAHALKALAQAPAQERLSVVRGDVERMREALARIVTAQHTHEARNIAYDALAAVPEAQVKPAAPVTVDSPYGCDGKLHIHTCEKCGWQGTKEHPCTTPPGDVAMQERPVSAIADKAADRIGWFILENLPPKTTIVWNKLKVAAIIQHAIDASQPTTAAPVLLAGYERVMALAHEAVKRGTDAMNSVSREAYMFASMLVQLEAANTQPAQRK